LLTFCKIKEYLAANSPRYAQRVAERLFAAVERLSEYPLSRKNRVTAAPAAIARLRRRTTFAAGGQRVRFMFPVR